PAAPRAAPTPPHFRSQAFPRGGDRGGRPAPPRDRTAGEVWATRRARARRDATARQVTPRRYSTPAHAISGHCMTRHHFLCEPSGPAASGGATARAWPAPTPAGGPQDPRFTGA